MECLQVRNQLSSFIDDLLSPEDSRMIREHLRICQKCEEDYADLRKTLEHIKALAEVEPPAWLTQKVMTKIRAEAEQDKSFFHKLFYPLHIKLPIEAFAMIAVAVIAFYVFKSTPSEMISVQGPTSVPRSQVLTEEDTPDGREDADFYRPVKKAPAPSEEKSAVEPADEEHEAGARMMQDKALSPGRLNKKDYGISGKDTKDTVRENWAVPAQPLEPQVIDRASDATGEGFASKQERFDSAKKKELLTSRDDSMAEERNELREFGNARISEKPESVARPAAPESVLRQRKKSAEIIQVQVRELASALTGLERAVSEIQGEIVNTVTHKRNAVVTARMDPSEFDEFLEKLRLLGTIKQDLAFIRQQAGSGDIMIELIEIPEP
jgi:hypothetical protein